MKEKSNAFEESTRALQDQRTRLGAQHRYVQVNRQAVRIVPEANGGFHGRHRGIGRRVVFLILPWTCAADYQFRDPARSWWSSVAPVQHRKFPMDAIRPGNDRPDVAPGCFLHSEAKA